MVHLEMAQEYARGESLSQLSIDAICMRLSAGIEVLARLDPAVRTRLFGESWQLMWGMRNRIAHGYLQVDSATVRRTVDVDLQSVMDTVAHELSEL